MVNTMATDKKNSGSGPYYDPYTGSKVGDYDRVYDNQTRTSTTDRFGRTRPK